MSNYTFKFFDHSFTVTRPREEADASHPLITHYFPYPKIKSVRIESELDEIQLILACWDQEESTFRFFYSHAECAVKTFDEITHHLEIYHAKRMAS